MKDLRAGEEEGSGFWSQTQWWTRGVEVEAVNPRVLEAKLAELLNGLLVHILEGKIERGMFSYRTPCP